MPSGVCYGISLSGYAEVVAVASTTAVSRPRTVSPKSVKKAIVASRSRTAMPTFSSLMGTPCTLPSQDHGIRPRFEVHSLVLTASLPEQDGVIVG